MADHNVEVAIPLKLQITNPEAMKRIRCLSISDAVDSFARMFFFSTLLEVCKQSTLYLTTLLQPMGTPEHLKNKPHYVETLKNIEQMELLDISRTVQPIPNEVSCTFSLHCFFDDMLV